MTPEERRRLDRHLDRLERVLTKDPETYRRQRKERLARFLAHIEKIRSQYKERRENGTETDEPKH